MQAVNTTIIAINQMDIGFSFMDGLIVGNLSYERLTED